MLKTVGTGAAASVMGLAGCTSSLGGGGESGPFRIGFAGVMSGPFSPLGTYGRRGAEMAVSQLNEGDGIGGREIEFTAKDAPDADTGVTRARELVQNDNVDVVIGCSGSDTELAVQEFVAGQDDVIYFSTGALSPSEVFFEDGECEPTFFRMESNLQQKTAAIAKTVVEESPSDATRVAGILPNYTFGKQTWEAFQSEITERLSGAEIVYETFPEFGQGDYQNEAQALLDANPDIVYTSMWASDLISFIQQAQQYNFFEQVPTFVSGSGTTVDVMTALGDVMPNMIGTDYYFFAVPDTDASFQFIQAYNEMFDAGETVNAQGSRWDGLTVPTHGAVEPGHTAVYALRNAAEAEGATDTDSLVTGLEGVEIDTPKGTNKVRAEDHEIIEANIVTGTIGDVDYWQYKGYSNVYLHSGSDVTGSPKVSCGGN